MHTKERNVARGMKPLAVSAVHRRRLSDGGDTGFDRSPRIVEMDTCQLRCRSSRITSRYAGDHQQPGASPLIHYHKPAAWRLHQGQGLEPPHPKTTHNTPRLGAFPAGYLGSPAKPGRAAACRDAGSSPRYMADTASSVARTRCQSAPRQRQLGEHAAQQEQAPAAAAEARPSVGRSGPRKHSRPQLDSFSFKSSEASRVDGSELSDEVTRDFYLDRLW